MKINLKIILSFTGLLLVINGVFMFLCAPYSIYFGGADLIPILISGVINTITGFAFYAIFRRDSNEEIKKRDGYLIVTIGWIVISLFGCLPYLLSGSIPDFSNAFFESISGYTTTGASILSDIEAQPKGILLWRSVTQWIGGMGIIVLTVAILPILGIGGMQLFVAESPGISPDKLHPRINETAKRMWGIYIGLTALEVLLLKIGGMGLYDAINHALTTMATGGFSTKQASVGAFESPFVQYVIILFMILAGTNFTLIYIGLHGKIRKALQNTEFKYYLGLLAIGTFIASIGLYFTDGGSFESAFRIGLFQVVSTVTTTGYATADYTAWAGSLGFLILILMFFGGMAGSTSGGVKLVRHIVLFKNSYWELKRLLHPSAVIPVRLNGRAISQSITFNVLAFIIIYILIFVFGSFLMTLLGVDFMTAIGSVATSLGNIGPGFGDTGPAKDFALLPTTAKWFLSFIMLLGRLELFTVLILFTPFFWSKN